jgi:peptide deformylase
MAIREILLLGNPGLRTKCEPILSDEIEFTKSVGQDLRDTMQAFRAEHGWGRAIAAPQIGIKKQIVFMEVHSPILFIRLHELPTAHDKNSSTSFM